MLKVCREMGVDLIMRGERGGVDGSLPVVLACCELYMCGSIRVLHTSQATTPHSTHPKPSHPTPHPYIALRV